MFENSQDLLNLTKAASILGLSIILGWFIFYLAMIMRQLFKAVKDARDRIKKIDEVVKALKEKIEYSASYLLLISEGVKKIVEMVMERKERAKEKKEKK